MAEKLVSVSKGGSFCSTKKEGTKDSIWQLGGHKGDQGIFLSTSFTTAHRKA